MALSLAPIKYRHVFSKHGGPIERLETFPQRSSDGRGRHGANAFLTTSLRPSWVSPLQLYADADGSGTHPVRNVACYIAISEALERWAFYTVSDGEHRRDYGFDKDPSTTGMAAFPSLWANQARAHASLEATERWSVVEWWLGRIPGRIVRQDDAEGIVEILSPFPDRRVVVVWRRRALGGLAYGFAAGASLQDAILHALVEQDRNIVALEPLTPPGSTGRTGSSGSKPSSVLERRLVFFASREGEALFHERRAQSDKVRSIPNPPRIITDRRIPGPWDRYTTVWRVLYEQTTDAHLDDKKNDFFLF